MANAKLKDCKLSLLNEADSLKTELAYLFGIAQERGENPVAEKLSDLINSTSGIDGRAIFNLYINYCMYAYNNREGNRDCGSWFIINKEKCFDDFKNEYFEAVIGFGGEI